MFPLQETLWKFIYLDVKPLSYGHQGIGVGGDSWELIHSQSERSVLALKIGPFRWVKYSPIFGPNLAPLNQGQYSPISYGWFGPRAEMGPTVGWNSLLIELFWPKLCSNGSRKGWIRLWPAGLNWPKIFVAFALTHMVVPLQVILYNYVMTFVAGDVL